MFKDSSHRNFSRSFFSSCGQIEKKKKMFSPLHHRRPTFWKMNSTHIFKPEILIKSFFRQFPSENREKKNLDMFNSNPVNLVLLRPGFFFFAIETENCLRKFEKISRETFKIILFWLFLDLCGHFDLKRKILKISHTFSQFFYVISRIAVNFPHKCHVSRWFFLWHGFTFPLSHNINHFALHLITFHSTVQVNFKISFDFWVLALSSLQRKGLWVPFHVYVMTRMIKNAKCLSSKVMLWFMTLLRLRAVAIKILIERNEFSSDCPM